MAGHKAPDSDFAGLSEPSEPCESSALEILVNGEARRVPPGCSLEQLLGLLGMGDRRVAVAVNGNVVARSQYATSKPSSGDRIEILEAVGGG